MSDTKISEEARQAAANEVANNIFILAKHRFAKIQGAYIQQLLDTLTASHEAELADLTANLTALEIEHAANLSELADARALAGWWNCQCHGKTDDECKCGAATAFITYHSERDALAQTVEEMKRDAGKLDPQTAARFIQKLGTRHNEFLEESVNRVVAERDAAFATSKRLAARVEEAERILNFNASQDDLRGHWAVESARRYFDSFMPSRATAPSPQLEQPTTDQL